MFYVYILQSSKDGRTYTGYTKNLNIRLRQHNSKQVKATRHRTPFKILFYEEFKTAQEAKNRELWWKSSCGRKELRKFFQEP